MSSDTHPESMSINDVHSKTTECVLVAVLLLVVAVVLAIIVVFAV